MKKDFQIYKKNKKSLKRFILSFKYCYEGFRYAFYHEQNVIVMLFVGIIALILGLVLNISYIERLVVILLILIIISLEMVNTAIECTVNALDKHNNYTKSAKDTASAAVGFASIMALVIGLIIYVPKIIELIRG